MPITPHRSQVSAQVLGTNAFNPKQIQCHSDGDRSDLFVCFYSLITVTPHWHDSTVTESEDGPGDSYCPGSGPPEADGRFVCSLCMESALKTDPLREGR